MSSTCHVRLHVGFRLTAEQFDAAFTSWEDEVFRFVRRWDPNTGVELPKQKEIIKPRRRSCYRILDEEFESSLEFADRLSAIAECDVSVTDDFVFVDPKFDVEETDGQHYTTEGGGIARYDDIVRLAPELARIRELFKTFGLDVGTPTVGVAFDVL